MLTIGKATRTIGGTELLAPISVTAKRGGCLVLRGPNGSGKTTLLRMIAGLDEPTSGEVLWDDIPVDDRDPRIRRAVSAQLGAPTAYRDLTLGDHLVLVDSTWGRDPESTETRIEEAFGWLGIGHLADRFPHELSSGQQQLFHLTLALFRPCDLLLLDEPEQRLDTDRRQTVTDLLRERADSGALVVLACHDPVMIEALGDTIVDVRSR